MVDLTISLLPVLGSLFPGFVGLGFVCLLLLGGLTHSNSDYWGTLRQIWRPLAFFYILSIVIVQFGLDVLAWVDVLRSSVLERALGWCGFRLHWVRAGALKYVDDGVLLGAACIFAAKVSQESPGASRASDEFKGKGFVRNQWLLFVTLAGSCWQLSGVSMMYIFFLLYWAVKMPSKNHVRSSLERLRYVLAGNVLIEYVLVFGEHFGVQGVVSEKILFAIFGVSQLRDLGLASPWSCIVASMHVIVLCAAFVFCSWAIAGVPQDSTLLGDVDDDITAPLLLSDERVGGSRSNDHGMQSELKQCRVHLLAGCSLLVCGLSTPSLFGVVCVLLGVSLYNVSISRGCESNRLRSFAVSFASLWLLIAYGFTLLAHIGFTIKAGFWLKFTIGNADNLQLWQWICLALPLLAEYGAGLLSDYNIPAEEAFSVPASMVFIPSILLSSSLFISGTLGHDVIHFLLLLSCFGILGRGSIRAGIAVGEIFSVSRDLVSWIDSYLNLLVVLLYTVFMIQSDYILDLVSKYEMEPLLDLLGLWTPAYARTVLQQMIPVVVTVKIYGGLMAQRSILFHGRNCQGSCESLRPILVIANVVSSTGSLSIFVATCIGCIWLTKISSIMCLLYLMLSVCVLLGNPFKSDQWIWEGSEEGVDEPTSSVMIGGLLGVYQNFQGKEKYFKSKSSKFVSWIPVALLVGTAMADFLVQIFVLVLVFHQDYFHYSFSSDEKDMLQSLFSINVNARGMALFFGLLRPFLVLSAIRFNRRMLSISNLASHAGFDQASLGIINSKSILGLCARFMKIISGTLVAVAIFSLALQAPCIMSWVFLLLLLVSMRPILQPRYSFHRSLQIRMVLVALITFWGLVYYLLSIEWVCSKLALKDGQVEFLKLLGAIHPCKENVPGFYTTLIAQFLSIAMISFSINSNEWKLCRDLCMDGTEKSLLFWPISPSHPPSTDVQGETIAPSDSTNILLNILRNTIENFYSIFGPELVLLSLLMTAFVANNVLSVACIMIVALNMICSNNILWNRYLMGPILMIYLLWQHTLSIKALNGRNQLEEEIWNWLGFSEMETSALWLMFTSCILISLEVSQILDKHVHTGDLGAPDVWGPLDFNTIGLWGKHDWARYYLFRYHIDLVLVAVVALCSIDDDFIHGGYLALSLFYFRSKINLRWGRNDLFKWLPIYNMTVIIIAIVYQSPFEILWNISTDEDHECTLAHLFGLYKFHGNGSDCNGDEGIGLLSLGRKGVLTDIILWVLLRLQTYLYSSEEYGKIVEIVEEEENSQRELHIREEDESILQQANSALQASEDRVERIRRIERIKRTMAQNVDKMISLTNPTPTDYNFLEEEQAEADFQRNGQMYLLSTPKSLRDLDHGGIDDSCVYGGENMRSWNKIKSAWNYMLSRADKRESNIAYVLFILAYVSDFSLVTMLLPFSAFVYALVSIKSANLYWKIILVYCEGVIISSYLYQVPARLNCEFLPEPLMIVAEFVGIHSNTARTIPIFFVYLATLFHVFGLESRNKAAQRLGNRDEVSVESTSESGHVGSSSEVRVPSYRAAYALVKGQSDNLNIWRRAILFLSQAFIPHEVPVSFLIVEFGKGHSVHGHLSKHYENTVQSIADNINTHLKVQFYSFIGISDRSAGDMVDESSPKKVLFRVTAHPVAQATTFLNPAKTLASVLTESEMYRSGEIQYCEHHSRQSQDWYALTVLFDIIAFIFVALSYNKMVRSPGSIQEITSQHVVPLGYLVTLLILFVFLVLDRLIYTIGSQAGKAVLHLMQIMIHLWYSEALVWSMGNSSTVHLMYLRMFLLLKCTSFALSALQLRSGYPPPASYSNGMGRHTFVFMRSISITSSAFFHIFAAIPFIYEIRQILDWSCTTTALTLYDWLKLEDINMSLYFAAVMQYANSFKPVGQKQPSYLKFFQGALSVFAILLLLWVPLLIFSSGNPITGIPQIIRFSNNVTISASSQAKEGFHYKFSQELFLGGQQNVWGKWIQSNSSLPRPLEGAFSNAQFQILCTSTDSESSWKVSPPLKKDGMAILEDESIDVTMAFGWHAVRDTPIESDHGGPACSGIEGFPLSWETRKLLVDAMDNIRGDEYQADPLRRISLKRRSLNESITSDVNSSTALVPAFWYFRGDSCEVRPVKPEDLYVARAIPGRHYHPNVSWSDIWLACDAYLSSDETNHIWWNFKCVLTNSDGVERDNSGQTGLASDLSFNECPDMYRGPMLVGLFDRTSIGIIGETISRFGVIGLYSVFVYGIGRFLRLAITNLRMRIPYENFPSTERLMSLCQDIYIARAEKLFELEEELYAALLAVYRLPNVMYELTTKKKN